MRDTVAVGGWAFKALILAVSLILFFNANRLNGLGLRQDEIKHLISRTVQARPGSVIWRDLFRGEWDRVCIVGAYGNRVNDNDHLWTIVFFRGRNVYARLDSSIAFIDIQRRAWSRGCYAPHHRAILVGSVAPFGLPTLIADPRAAPSTD